MVATTYNCSWCGLCSACSPTTRGLFEPRDIFLQFMEERTAPDGSDLGPWLARLFQVLNTPVEDRQTALDEDLARFPYINGDLFAEHLRFADFNAGMRSILLDACRFDWTAISPAIFGALFQSVMEPVERRQQGAHLHDREEHPQGNRAAVPGRPAGGVRAAPGAPGRACQGRSPPFPRSARNLAVP